MAAKNDNDRLVRDVLRVFIHIAGRLFQLQLYGGFENGDHPKNCRQKNDNRITVPLEQFVVVEVP